MKYIIEISERVVSHVIINYMDISDNDRAMICDAVRTAIPYEERQHGECNQCRYYEGVHGVQGHAPCSFWGIGGVLSSDYCSRFEKEGEAE